jgi:O-antigen/teichoic acid export membrane protein
VAGRYGLSVDVIIDSLKILAGKGVVIVCSAVFGIIIARLLLPGDRGILAVVMAVPAMLSAILQLGIRQSTVASYSSKQLRDSFKSELLGMLAVLCPIGALAALVALYSALPNDFDAPLWFVVIASMQVPISLCSVFSQGVYLGEKRLAEFNLVQWLPSVVTTAILCALYLAQCASLMAVLATIVAATAGVALYSIYKADLACRAPSFSWVFIKQQIAYGANASLALFVITVLSRATIVIVTKMAGPRCRHPSA